jgi:NIMA (never in mitosis gene a)-related kinase
MELADGGDLLKKIHKHKAAGVPMPEKDIWDIIIQLIRGLKTLHEMNILHRDLKSSNIFLCRDGTVKIGDLNVSKIADQGLVYTQTGTPYYASPEVWRDRPYDLKSDMWSLGCVIYEMATQQPPFRAKDMESLFKRVVRGLYSELPSTYSNDLSNLVRSLLQVKPSLRPSCDQVLQLPLMSRNLNSSRQAEVQSEPNHGLIETIKLPPSLRSLSSKLPAAKYERNLSACSPVIGCDNKENIFRSRNHSRDSARRFTGHKPEVRIPLGERKNHGMKIDDVKLPPIFNSSIFRK